GGPDDGGVEPVVLGVPLSVDDAGARHLQGAQDRVDHVSAASLAEVRHARDQRLRAHPGPLRPGPPRSQPTRRPMSETAYRQTGRTGATAPTCGDAPP